MARFVKHEACPRCGSRDNLGRYDDGSAFCFGCHYTERADKSPFVGQRDEQDETEVLRPKFPDDAVPTLGIAAWDWLSKYGITGVDAIKSQLRWSPYWEQLLIPLFSGGEICCIQAKNFNPKRASKAKYYNIGDKSLSTTVYGTGKVLVLTEDVVSSLRVGHTTAAMPLLGTHIAINRLAALKRVYQTLVVWLDEDKWREAREIADAASLLGFNARSILTPKDPKEYLDEEIQEFLK